MAQFMAFPKLEKTNKTKVSVATNVSTKMKKQNTPILKNNFSPQKRFNYEQFKGI